MSWGNSAPPPIFEHEDELALKLEWARLTRGDEKLFRSAGYQVFEGPEDYGRAMQAYNWRHDPIVHAEWQRLAEAPELEQVNEKLTIVEKMAIDIINSPTASNADKIKAGTLLAEMNGAIKQNGTNINIANDNSTNNTIVVPSLPATEEELEVSKLRTEKRQARLMEHARSRTIEAN